MKMGEDQYGTGLGLLQVLGYVLVFMASVPAAFAIRRTKLAQPLPTATFTFTTTPQRITINYVHKPRILMRNKVVV